MSAYHTQSALASLQSECQGLGTQGHRLGWLDRGVSHCPSRCTGHTHSCAQRLWGPRQCHTPTRDRRSYWGSHSSQSQSRGSPWPHRIGCSCPRSLNHPSTRCGRPASSLLDPGQTWLACRPGGGNRPVGFYCSSHRAHMWSLYRSLGWKWRRSAGHRKSLKAQNPFPQL